MKVSRTYLPFVRGMCVICKSVFLVKETPKGRSASKIQEIALQITFDAT